MNEQQKGIKKTVLIIVAIMATFLVLFFNKITTPRYLSDIELKVNGLVLIDEIKRVRASGTISDTQWMLIVNNEQDKQLLEGLRQSLKGGVGKKIILVDQATVELNTEINTTKKIIPILKPSGEYLGYLTSPYDKKKLIVTLSSVVTHR
ncbi:MAG: hypothetical protein ACI9D5_001617 [Candidatus Endobugula sp.]|jgi:hypothetical protein